jgi:hypothetical protein
MLQRCRRMRSAASGLRARLRWTSTVRACMPCRRCCSAHSVVHHRHTCNLPRDAAEQAFEKQEAEEDVEERKEFVDEHSLGEALDSLAVERAALKQAEEADAVAAAARQHSAPQATLSSAREEAGEASAAIPQEFDSMNVPPVEAPLEVGPGEEPGPPYRASSNVQEPEVSTGAPARTLRTSSGLDRTTRTSSFLDVQPLSLAGAGQEHLTKRSLDSVGRAATTESLPEASSSASRELATAADANNAGTPVATQGSNEPALQEFVPSATSAEEAADALWRAQTEVGDAELQQPLPSLVSSELRAVDSTIERLIPSARESLLEGWRSLPAAGSSAGSLVGGSGVEGLAPLTAVAMASGQGTQGSDCAVAEGLWHRSSGTLPR